MLERRAIIDAKHHMKVEVLIVEKVVEKGYTKEDMDTAIAKALEANERARQARKAEKKREIILLSINQ